MGWLRYMLVAGLAVLLSACAGPAQLLGGQARWCAAQGGVLADATRSKRASSAAGRVSESGFGLRVWVLDSASIAAYSYEDGNIYLTRGLMDAATDEELAAAIAHELGHLMADGHLSAGAYAGAVARTRGMEKEARADAVGAAVLRGHGIPPRVLAGVLAKVARAAKSESTRDAVWERVARITN